MRIPCASTSGNWRIEDSSPLSLPRGSPHPTAICVPLRSPQEIVEDFYDQQLAELELAAERQRIAKLLAERESPV